MKSTPAYRYVDPVSRHSLVAPLSPPPLLLHPFHPARTLVDLPSIGAARHRRSALSRLLPPSMYAMIPIASASTLTLLSSRPAQPPPRQKKPPPPRSPLPLPPRSPHPPIPAGHAVPPPPPSSPAPPPPPPSLPPPHPPPPLSPAPPLLSLLSLPPPPPPPAPRSAPPRPPPPAPPPPSPPPHIPLPHPSPPPRGHSAHAFAWPGADRREVRFLTVARMIVFENGSDGHFKRREGCATATPGPVR